MRLRADLGGRLERELRDLREGIEQTEKERAQHVELAERADAERQAAAEDPAAYGEAAGRASSHRVEVDRLAFVLERRQQDLAEHERRLEDARFAEAYAKLEQAAERCHEASKKFSSATAGALRAEAALQGQRDDYEAALARARELCPADVELELPELADEASLPEGVERLVEMVQAGPRQPLADEARALAEGRRQREASAASEVEQVLRDALRHGDFQRFERLPAVRRQAALTAAEHRVGAMTGTDRELEACRRRLERLRELVAEAEVGDAAAAA